MSSSSVRDAMRIRGFLRRLAGFRLSTRELSDDARLAGVNVRRADRDQDGWIQGRRELRRLFAVLDRVDGRADGRIGQAGAASAIHRAGAGADLDNAIVIVGLSETSIAEARQLRRFAEVQLITDASHGTDSLHHQRQLFDFARDEDRRGFVASLRLPAHVQRQLHQLLSTVPRGSRREMAALMRIWAPGERGQRIPRRLMISGHGDGVAFFGNDHDRLDVEHIARLAAVLPAAAAQIRGIHLATCQHGYAPRMARIRRVFPNLESVWGYAGFSPSGPAAWRHQRVWERATRQVSGGSRRRLSPSLVAGTRRARSVAVWTRETGWEGPPARPLSEIHHELHRARGRFRRHFLGGEPNRPTGFLQDFYQRTQELTNHHDFRDQSTAFRQLWQARREASLRLRFYDSHVAAMFDRHHRRAVERGFGALGLDAPRFDRLSRAAALDAIAAFDARLQSNSPRAARHLWPLLEGLRDLTPHVVPIHWL